MIAALVLAVGLCIADGFVSDALIPTPHDRRIVWLRTWIIDFRFLAEQIIYASAILFIGARFFEQRTLITIAFDKPDAGKMAVMGPDENGFIWIGRKYPSRLEGETAVAVLKSRIMQAGEKNFGEYGY